MTHLTTYTSDGKVFALKSGTSEIAWSKQVVPADGSNAPVLYKDLVILQMGCQIWALKASDGSIVWNYLPNSRWVSSPCVGNDMIYFSVMGKAYALSAATGELVWQQSYGAAEDWATPII